LMAPLVRRCVGLRVVGSMKDIISKVRGHCSDGF